jgi:Flp pilus assembly protein TadG
MAPLPAPPRHCGKASRGREGGSATLELVILTPGLLLVIALLIGVGRTQHAHQALEAAARDAARQASLARTPTQAHTAATTSALAALDREGLACSPSVTVDTAGLHRPVGSQAAVSAEVTCRLPLSALMPGLPGSTQITSRFTSPIDPYRAGSEG